MMKARPPVRAWVGTSTVFVGSEPPMTNEIPPPRAFGTLLTVRRKRACHACRALHQGEPPGQRKLGRCPGANIRVRTS